MPSLLCKCEHKIQYGAIPCPDEWLFISDEGYDQFSGDVNAEEIYRAMSSFLKCPNCGRLWVFWEGFAKPPTAYKAE